MGSIISWASKSQKLLVVPYQASPPMIKMTKQHVMLYK